MKGLTGRRAAVLVVLVGVGAATGCSEPDNPDPVVRGESIHSVCLSCHGTDLYTSPQREITSLPALREEVARWGDYYNPALSEQDVDDVTAYLNANFYKF